MDGAPLKIQEILKARAKEFTRIAKVARAVGDWEATTYYYTKVKCCLEVARIAERLDVD